MLCTCRVLLAALAVSCTLSRIHANGPSTQRLDRIKDLMCVLLLSGMQKDDLDASVLNKLQRHNVNMHDMNDKEFLQECTTFQYSNNENITPQINTMDTKYSLVKLTPKIEDVNMNYNLTKVNIKNSDDSTKYENRNKNYEDVIKYVDGQPELKSVLNFWKDIKVDNSSKITESPIKLTAAYDVVNKNYRPEQKNKRNVPDATNSNESDDLQKLLLNFILKSQNKHINNKSSNKKSIEIGDLYNNVYLLGTRNDNKNTEINENDDTAGLAPVKMALLQATPVKQYDLMNNLGKNNWQLKIPDRDRDTDREGQRTIKPNNFNDILNHLQPYYPIKSRDKSVENVNENNKEIDNLYFSKFSERLTTEKLIHPKIIEQKMTQNIIKEIANTVKELILSDLRKEMFQTTTSFSTTEKQSTRTSTTERDYITPTVKMENHIEQTILSKFMDLFEEIKTLKHKSLIISSENKKENLKVEKNYNTYPEVMPIINNNNGMANTHNNYKTKLQYPKPNSQKIFNFSPQIHKFRLNTALTESIVQAPNKRALPITVQTNNMEIPPLGIPVSNPENPISQNIIVPTMRPYRIGDYDNIKSSDSRIGPNDYIPKKSENRILKSLEQSLYDQKNNKRFTLINDHSNYNGNLDDEVSLNRFKQSTHREEGPKRGSQPRFHEKLERARDNYNHPNQNEYTNKMVDCCDERYAFSKQMVDCCNRKVAARQQLSLNQVKKRPSYDDTHFNNFLKSQKKVTDMLERILASRGRVRSVELA